MRWSERVPMQRPSPCLRFVYRVAAVAGLVAQIGAAVTSPAACSDVAEMYQQIWTDFEATAELGPITSANISDLLKKVHAHNAHEYYFVEVAIIDRKLYMRGDPRRLGVWQRATMKLIDVAVERYGQWIPDVHFVMSVLDEPFLERGRDNPWPLLSSVSTRRHWDIPMPANAFFDEGGISSSNHGTNFVDWESEDFQSRLEQEMPWERRVEKAFFRGHDWESINTHIESLDTRPAEQCVDKWSVTSSFGYRRWYEELSAPGGALQELADVGLTGAPDFYKPKRKGRPFVAPVSIPDHAKHKYLLHLDGTAHSTRLAKLFTLGSVVIKQDSPYEEYFCRSLRPYEHFVPLSRDRCSHDNFTATVKWLKSNDGTARRIARSGQNFQRRFLTIGAAACYWQRTLAVYGALQAFDPRLAIRVSEFTPWSSI